MKFLLLLSIADAASAVATDVGTGLASLNNIIDAQLQKLRREVGSDNCQYACSILSLLVPLTVSISDSPNYTAIPYWSAQQAAVTPACRIDVSSAQEIATTLQVSNLTSCPFAVRSGGHTSFAGASSIQNGILINLAKLNEVTLSADRKSTRVGPGNTWGSVYEVLDELGVSVIGGRESGIGVGGLLLGGGISYFSGRYGWGCDNVLSYEVILANGSIVNASVLSNPDLYFALRGGSGTNFGLVSRFDLMTFEQGPLWGGSRLYSMNYSDALIDAFGKFAVDAPTDDFAHLYIAFVYSEAPGGFLAATGPAYGRPVENASIFQDVNGIPALLDATGIHNMSYLAAALNQTTFSREIFKTVTFKNDPSLLKQVLQIFIQEVSSVLNVSGLAPAFAIQPLSLNIIEKMTKNGGNALGLDTNDGPLMILDLNWGWTFASDDVVVWAAVDHFFSRSVDLARKMGLDHRFIYMNYASQDQDVFAGYGTNNERKLERIRRQYDPDGLFERLQPGYFKLKE